MVRLKAEEFDPCLRVSHPSNGSEFYDEGIACEGIVDLQFEVTIEGMIILTFDTTSLNPQLNDYTFTFLLAGIRLTVNTKVHRKPLRRTTILHSQKCRDGWGKGAIGIMRRKGGRRA